MEWTRTATMVCMSIALAGCADAPTTIVLDRPIDAPRNDASSSGETSSTIEPSPADTHAGIRLDMDFATQAPMGDWDAPYDEACEEASLIVVHHYLEGTPLDPSIMDSGIRTMVAYEGSIGLLIDIDMHELARVARDMFGYSTEVVEGDGVTVERIEQELARGIPVILPLAGQDIGNPYYSGDGPPYHVLVVVGFNSDQFITHDVGTKRGAYYAYDKGVLMAAIHDWNGSVDTIRSGPRRMLVVTKQMP